MKNILSIVLITLFGVSTFNSFGQKTKKKEEITIQTSAQCNMCKQSLEKAMAYEKGIVSSNLDVKTAKFTVVYKTDKTTPEKIKIAISKAGYDADDMEANKKSYDNLPDCCKKGGHK